MKLTGFFPGIEKILLELENRSKKHTEATVGRRLVGFRDQFLRGWLSVFFCGGDGCNDCHEVSGLFVS